MNTVSKIDNNWGSGGTNNSALLSATIHYARESEGSGVSVTDVALDKTSLDLTVGDSEKLVAKITYITPPTLSTDHPNVIWTSSDESVVTFSKKSGSESDVWGLGAGSTIIASKDCTVKAVGAGTATITVTATTESGSKTATCTVTVSRMKEPGPTDGRLDSSEGAQVAVSQVLQTGQVDDFAFYYATFEDAVAFFNDGTNAPVIFKLLTDCTCDSVSLIGIGFSATIDLAGHTLSVDNLKVESKCKLEIRDTVGGGCIFGPIEINAIPDNFVITGGTISDITENGQLWSLTNKVLTISGIGAIPDYDSHLDVPWDYLTAESSWYVNSIIVEKGITRIGDRAFAFYGGKTLMLPNTVISLGEYSIGFTSYSDDHITYLEIPASVTRIEAGAFDYTKDLMVKFLGSAPVFSKDTPVFDRSSDITIYYPAGDASWAPYAEATPPATLGAEKITWIAYGSEYQVTVPTASNGVVTVTPKSAKSGEKVTVIAAPDKGYVVDKITVALADGNEVKVTDNGDGIYSFTMPAAAVTVTATFKAVETNITISNTAGGTVTSNAANAKNGDTVTLTSKANMGYISAVPTVKDKDDKAVTVTKNADGTWSFIMPEGGVTITGNYLTLAQMFSDLSDSAWYRNDMAFAVENSLVSSNSGKYDPNTALTRGMMVTLLYNLETKLSGKPTAPSASFTDVPTGQYYTDAVAWASYNGIVDGVGNNAYNPGGKLDRQQMATMLYNYAAYKGYDINGAADLSGYTDAGQIKSWALAGMRWANSVGIVTGSNSALDPTGPASRLQGAVLLTKFCREVVGMK